jgi:membrane fusion protein, multidrug efflux system
VIEVPERRLGGLKLGDSAMIALFTGEKVEGTIRFIARRPAGVTRTYRVDVAFQNPSGAIPDGVAAEVVLSLAPILATKVPRSTLVFASSGQLGVRIVDAAAIVQFVPVRLIDDAQDFLWISGVEPGMRIITRGQEFIREGQSVEVVLDQGVKP